MIWNWEKVKSYFEEQTIWTSENELYWYRMVWELLTEKGLTIFHDNIDKLSNYGKIIAMVRAYHEFCQAGFEESPEFDIYFSDISEEINEFLLSEASDSAIFEALNEKLGREITFYSLWITAVVGEEEPYSSYGEYVSLIKNSNHSMLNEVTPSKMAAYEWLSEKMR